AAFRAKTMQPSISKKSMTVKLARVVSSPKKKPIMAKGRANMLCAKSTSEKYFFIGCTEYYCGSTLKLRLISAIVFRMSSQPKWVSEDVRNTCGTSSNHSRRAFLNFAMFWVDLRLDCLSALVKTRRKGIPLSPSHLQKSRSIFCGSCRLSIKTNRHCRFSLTRKYLRINFSQSSRRDRDVLAYP